MTAKTPFKDADHPRVLDSYGVYAHNLHVARRVYEHARAQSDPTPPGTVGLETGAVVNWINMNYGVARQGRSS